MTDFKEWQAAMNEKFNKEISGPEAELRAEQKQLFTSRTLEVVTPILTFSIRSRLLPRHQRLIGKLRNADETDYDAVQDAISTILGDLCVDSQYDKQFWIGLDEETGFLPDVFTLVGEEIHKSQQAGVNFR